MQLSSTGRYVLVVNCWCRRTDQRRFRISDYKLYNLPISTIRRRDYCSRHQYFVNQADPKAKATPFEESAQRAGACATLFRSL